MLGVIFLLDFVAKIKSQSDFIDLHVCKLTQSGTEYLGNISKTRTNLTCQFWNSVTQGNSEKIVDESFPEGSKSSALNYCRNPTEDPRGPWCYAGRSKHIYDACNVPFCANSACRTSGTGMEYAGPIDVSSSGKKCKTWRDVHESSNESVKVSFEKTSFPDGEDGLNGKNCRNPDGNLGGPWCYVENETFGHPVKEFCDIPFCDDTGTVMYSEGSFSGQYFFFTSMSFRHSLNVSIRLWNPSDWLRGQFFLLFSAYDVALDREDVDKWKSGVEIVISHGGSGVIFNDEEEFRVTKTPFILSGGKWTNLMVNWTKDNDSRIIVEAYENSNPKPFAAAEIPIAGTIFEFETFRFFSFAGSPSIVNVESAESMDEGCFVHTAPQMKFARFWLMNKTGLGIGLEIFVRAKREAVVAMRSAPMIESNQIQVIFEDKDKIKVIAFDEKNVSQVVKEKHCSNVLNFWKWEYFKLMLIKDKLQVYWVRDRSTEILLEANHPNIAGVLWVGFASPRVSYWTVYCDPRGIADPPPAKPPECVSENSELFNGTLSVTKKGYQCIPWADKCSVPSKYGDEELFEAYGGIAACENFCRNLDNDADGAFCIIRNSSDDSGFSKAHCHPRPCRMGECKMAGTGNDYLGKLNLTRSKRECTFWTDVNDPEINVTNFPDPSLEDAENFCRNPSKSITGCWCYTEDPKVPRDFCYVRDCDKPLDCTVLTTGFLSGMSMYILPRWRKNGLEFWLKAWNPDIYEGLIFSLISIDESQEYAFFIGDEQNEKVKLFYKCGESVVLLEHKTLPHIVPTGKWSGYWLRPGHGKLELGYEGVSHSFFEWSSTTEDYAFEPVFINFGTIDFNWIGINFRCDECLVEKTSVNKENKIYPMNLWKNDDDAVSSLSLNLRGTGSAIVTLMWTLDFNRSLSIQVDSVNGEIRILRYSDSNEFHVVASFPVAEAILEDEWSEYVVSHAEDNLIVSKNSEQLFCWRSSYPLLFYWFSVSAMAGSIIWTANCPPPDIDGDPRDGGWSDWGPWTCSVTCGKGKGTTERKCDNPRPNVFGKECEGISTYAGTCNDFPCGEVSPGTHKLIRRYLSSQHKSLRVGVKERVSLDCNPEGLSLVAKEVRELNITWTHNGMRCSKTKFHVAQNHTLVISHAGEKHNGVYLCTVNQGPNGVPSEIVLEVVSLVVVVGKPTKKIREGSGMVLKCNGLALSNVYEGLSQRWELNETVWRDYGMGAMEMVATDNLINVQDSHTGIWTCVVTQEDFKFKWITNWINLKVKSAPSFWPHLLEEVSTSPLFAKVGNEKNIIVLFFTMIFALMAIIVALVVVLIKMMMKLNVVNCHW